MARLIKFELIKIFTRRITLIALAALIGVSVMFGFGTYHSMYAVDGSGTEGKGKTAVEIDKNIASKYEGILTDEKVQQILAEFRPMYDLHGMNAKYLYQNAMQSAAYAQFSDMNGAWNGRSVSDVFGDEEIKIGYINGWLSSSRNMIKIFIFLSLVIIVMLAPIFSGEYGGVDNIILTSRYGKTKCVQAKAIAGLIASLLVSSVCIWINAAMAFAFYGGDGLGCSILFAPTPFDEGYIPFNITCGTLLKYQVMLVFTSAFSVTGVTLLMSAMCKSQMAAVVASAAIHLFPMLLPISENSPVFKLVVLLPLYHSQFLSIMSVKQTGNGMMYALWAIPIAIAFMAIGAIISCRKFANHQVN